MNIPGRPELPTAALRSSQATHAAVDNSAPLPTHPESTYKSRKAVQTNGATSPLGVSALDEDWVALNQMIKYYKFGYGKATEYANEDIRLGRLTREEAISFFEKYDGVCAKEYIQSFCAYIGISVTDFWEQVRAASNKTLFKIDSNGLIRPRFRVGIGL